MCSGWASHQTAVLIDLYQNEEGLYRVKSPIYHNKFARQKALENITKNLLPIKPDVTVAQVKAKINALRSRFSSELQKIRSRPSGAGADDNNVSFQFFARLLFLSDHVQARQGKLNLDLFSTSSTPIQTLEVEDDSDKENADVTSESWAYLLEEAEEKDKNEKEHEKVPSNFASPSSLNSSLGEPRRKKTKSDPAETFLLSAGEVLNKLSGNGSDAIEDEWQHFGNFISSSIRKLSTRKLQQQCKHKILNALMQSEEQDLL